MSTSMIPALLLPGVRKATPAVTVPVHLLAYYMSGPYWDLAEAIIRAEKQAGEKR